MELWIRSQDKTILSKMQNIIIRENQNENNEINYAIVDIYTMGIYKTKERTLEILDEIQKLLEPQKIIKTIDNTIKIENALHIVNPTYETITQLGTYVYEMPKN